MSPNVRGSSGDLGSSAVNHGHYPVWDAMRPGLSSISLIIFFWLWTALKDSTQGPPTANHQTPPTAINRQPPTANRHQPPTANRQPLKYRGSHEAESVLMNIRFYWRYEGPPPPPP